MPKCQWCKEVGEKEVMYCDEKPTGQFNKNGSPKMFRKYFHSTCHDLQLKDKEYKLVEADKLTDLYNYILSLHNIIALDGRMMEKIQDLRNGSVKINNKKVTKYKEGVPYEVMLQTYIHLASTIDGILHSMHFNEKWNEFSYIFGTVTRSVNDVMKMNKHQDKQIHKAQSVPSAEVEIQVLVKEKKTKDNLDISEFL
ncbi:hypothetical protein ACQKNX_07580 [Lysinibacillus sp. NPDC093712]|uniref:hypothetical protein n=1 Tax=Lysinibacillus sp. NPDC093712 TaxID=3390579 RepID=UPI003CFC847F